jgi:hypothetical protein
MPEGRLGCCIVITFDGCVCVCCFSSCCNAWMHIPVSCWMPSPHAYASWSGSVKSGRDGVTRHTAAVKASVSTNRPLNTLDSRRTNPGHQWSRHYVSYVPLLLLCCHLTLCSVLAFVACYALFGDSVFGEDALVNVSVEKKDDNDGKLAGYIRIRSKTQGIALSLGDRITSVQRGLAGHGSTH